MRIINHLFGRDYTILSRFLETVLEAVLEDEFVTFGDGFFGVVGVDPAIPGEVFSRTSNIGFRYILSGLTHRLDKLGAPPTVARDKPVIRVFG